jgi:hypothetical protein
MNSRALCLTLLAAGMAACGGGGNALPIGVGNGGATTLDVAGTWSGSANDSNRQMTMTWQLSQQNRSVAGTFAATTVVGAPIYTSGNISGTLSNTALTFTITVPRGSVVDAPDCTALLAGTADDVRQDSMAGTYTGSDTCGGTFAGGRFTLLKQ